MKKVVSFSGGRTSAYLCKVMIDTYGRENVDFIYMDTGAEHSKTYEFIRKVNHEFGLNLVCLRGDFTKPLGAGVGYSVVDIKSLKPDLKPFKAMMSKYGVPYIGGMFCTDRMKLKPFKKYCDDTYGKKNYETWLGIRADEPVRFLSAEVVKLTNDPDEDTNGMLVEIFKTMRLNDGDVNGPYDIFDGMWPEPSNHERANYDCKWDRAVSAIDEAYKNKAKNNLYYMAEISGFDKQDVLNYWSKMPFDLDLDEWSGNCEFCPKKSNLKLAASAKDEPESYNRFLSALNDSSVRVVESRTISLMKSMGVKPYKLLSLERASKNLINAYVRYNSMLFTEKNPKWAKYSKTANNQMYRGKQSLESLIATFDGSTGDEIKARIRGGKQTDTNSCSESCEVFVGDDDE
jgi:3'-phosphoadenosine 5'-phosphosulfate sulfotransferase (PAPS reductase)/FAD synthetase